MRRELTVIGGLALLACSGVGGGGGAGPEPAPDGPTPAPNAEACARWHGAALPMKGGVIVACSQARVTVDHGGGDGKALRWDYADRFVDAGWARADPTKGFLQVVRGSESVLLGGRDGNVTLAWQN